MHADTPANLATGPQHPPVTTTPNELTIGPQRPPQGITAQATTISTPANTVRGVKRPQTTIAVGNVAAALPAEAAPRPAVLPPHLRPRVAKPPQAVIRPPIPQHALGHIDATQVCIMNISGTGSWEDPDGSGCLKRGCRDLHICKTFWLSEGGKDMPVKSKVPDRCPAGGAGVSHVDPPSVRIVVHIKPSCPYRFPKGIGVPIGCRAGDQCKFGHDQAASRDRRRRACGRVERAVRRSMTSHRPRSAA
jgi:hypothetical protein